jgi:hypothetical protein
MLSNFTKKCIQVMNSFEKQISVNSVPDCKTSYSSSSEDLVRNFAKLNLKSRKVNMALEKLLESKKTTETILSGHGAK